MRRPGSMASAWTLAAISQRSPLCCRHKWRCRGIWILWPWWPADRRWRPRPRRSSRRCAGGRSSLTWATGSCLKRRPSMWRRCWSWCVQGNKLGLERGGHGKGVAPVRGIPAPVVPVVVVPERDEIPETDASVPVRRKVAIVLFNLGGPDRPEAIKPFLLNLFRDPAILRVPFFVRPFLARTIARARRAPATENYALLGGKSPLLGLTQEQAVALEAALPEVEARCFIAMRYWHPFSLEAARAVKAWGPDEVVLLPLYPQFSTTTTGSSLAAWRDAAVRVGLTADTTRVCCYPVDPAYATATAT